MGSDFDRAQAYFSRGNHQMPSLRGEHLHAIGEIIVWSDKSMFDISSRVFFLCSTILRMNTVYFSNANNIYLKINPTTWHHPREPWCTGRMKDTDGGCWTIHLNRTFDIQMYIDRLDLLDGDERNHSSLEWGNWCQDCNLPIVSQIELIMFGGERFFG